MKLFTKDELTERELELMCLLWKNDKPLTFSDIQNSTTNISKNSIHKILNKLMDMGFVKVAGTVTIGKAVNRMFTNAISAEEYTWHQMNKIFKPKENKSPLTPLLLYLVKNKKYNEKIKTELRNIVETMEEDE